MEKQDYNRPTLTGVLIAVLQSVVDILYLDN